MYKLIASDIDGTIMPKNEILSDRTKHAVRMAQKRGCKIILSTGRRMASAEVVANTLSIGSNPVISHCGAGISIASTGEILKTVTIPTEVAKRVFDLASSCGPKISIHQDPKLGRNVYMAPLFHLEKTLSQNSWYGSFCLPFNELDPSHLDKPIQISLIGSQEEVRNALFNVKTEFKDELVYIDYGNISFGYFVDIFARGTSKANSLMKISNQYGIKPDEIVAFGDGSNDVEMLEYSGLPVAMENSSELLKKHAKIIAPTNEEDGVAVVIEKLLSENLI